MGILFLKMHGAGNDFVVVDSRDRKINLTPELLRHFTDRRLGVGCDQFVLLEPSQKADVFMRIYNADGSEVSACGNASRCVGWLMMEERQKETATIETRAGLLNTFRTHDAGYTMITVDMGEPRLGWQEIPLSREVDTLCLPLTAEGGIKGAVAVSMGNPHAVFFVDHPESIKLASIGPRLENDALFPERANISVAKVETIDKIRLRVWERGAGETLACGTAACATLVAANLRGLAGRRAAVSLPGGDLLIEWLENNHVMMTGAVATSFKGEVEWA